MITNHSSIALSNSNSSHTIGPAFKRINRQFLSLLDSQFPIEDLRTTIKLRTPSDFANELNIHVNHLNRVLNSIHKKTTSNIIQDQIHKESKRLLEDSDWNVSEIAFCLGFTEVTHFNNFFRKLEKASPNQFRKSVNK